MSIKCEYPVTRIVTKDVADTPELTGDWGKRAISTPKDDRALTAGLPLLGLGVFGPIACLLRSLYRAFQFEEVLTSVRQSYKRAPSGSSDTGIARRCRRYR